MTTFDYKGTTVSVYHTGGIEPVNFIDNSINPITHLSGDRIEFSRGGGKLIYQVLGVLYETSGYNRVQAQSIFLNQISGGTDEVIVKRDVGYSVSKEHFDAMAQLPTVSGTTILETLHMHFLNGILARIPELGGDEHGRGLELFNNDGSIDTPLFTYKRAFTNSATVEIVPVTVSTSYKVLVDGVEYFKTVQTETMNADGSISITEIQEQTLIVENLPTGFHQFEYQELDVNGLVTASQVRNILL